MQPLIPKRIDAELNNWARYQIHHGESPIPMQYKEAGWVRFMKREEETVCESARTSYDALAGAWIEHEVYQKLPLVCRHVMAAWWLCKHWGANDLTKRLNTLVQRKALDVPHGFQFSRYQIEADISYIARKTEAALEIRARGN